MTLRQGLLAFLLFTAPAAAFAIPANYRLTFTVDTGTVVTTTLDPPSSTTQQSAVGNVYFGFFGIDSALLANDGTNQPADLLYFWIKMEDNVWAVNAPVGSPLPNYFGGFRGPEPGCVQCLGAASPGFDIVNHAIAGLEGVVSGLADVPEVAFAGDTFRTIGISAAGLVTSRYLSGGDPTNFTAATGHFTVTRIPEPAPFLLLGIGVLAIIFRSRLVK